MPQGHVKQATEGQPHLMNECGTFFKEERKNLHNELLIHTLRSYTSSQK